MFGYTVATAAAVVFQPWALIPIVIVGSIDYLGREIRRAEAMPQSYHDECARIDSELREKGL
ncbi:MAG: hypothetical protein WAQ27_04900 [Candidatus Microsaccharimonas sp.]|jgi:hypothetical protein